MEHPEILLIDKPAGITSFDVVYEVRRKLNPKPEKKLLDVGLKRTHGVDAVRGATESVDEDVLTSTATDIVKGATKQSAPPWVRLKVGHAGTLDPLATGLMIIGVGKGTKKLTELVKLDKEYIAEVRIGERRTTGDLEGDVVEELEASEISRAEIESAVISLIGTLCLPVSAYSAIKIDGKPMYKRAREAERKGETVTDVPMRNMVVYEAEVLHIQKTEIEGKARMVVTVRFFVASGVYIRSLGEELGKRLGYPATLQNLRRTKVGKFCIEDAQNIDELTK